jgi:hypothetical protein
MAYKVYWTLERLKIVEEVYALENVVSHYVAVHELKKRGIKTTRDRIQAVVSMYEISRPYILKGNPNFRKN